MAFSRIGGVKAGSANGLSATTGTLDTTGANLLIMSVCRYVGVSGTVTISDSKSNTWTPLDQHGVTSSTTHRLYYSIPTSVGSGHTFTVDGGLNLIYPCLQVEAWSGAHATPLGATQNGATATSGSTIQTGSITPSENNTLLIAGVAYDDNSGGAVSIDLSFAANAQAQIAGFSIGGAIAYLLLGTAAAKNPTWDLTNAGGDTAAGIAYFKAAASAAGNPWYVYAQQ
jgi:hypothetical protein